MYREEKNIYLIILIIWFVIKFLPVCYFRNLKKQTFFLYIYNSSQTAFLHTKFNKYAMIQLFCLILYFFYSPLSVLKSWNVLEIYFYQFKTEG